MYADDVETAPVSPGPGRRWHPPCLSFEVGIFLAALSAVAVQSLASRLRRRQVVRIGAQPKAGRSAKLYVGFTCVAGGPTWTSVVEAVLRAAAHPLDLHFVIVVECQQAEDALMEFEDSLFRNITTLVHLTRTAPNQYARRARRLLRHIVADDADFVAIIDPRLRFVHRFDALLSSLGLQRGEVVTSPVSAHAAAFPILQPWREGRGAVRGFSTPFAKATSWSEVCILPSVVWCVEFTFGLYETFATWPSRCADLLDQTDVTFFCTTAPLFVADASLENAVLDAMARMPASRAPTPNERIGLSFDPYPLESAHKFGSTRVSKLSQRFARQRKDA